MSDGRLFIACTVCGESLKLASTYFDPEQTVAKMVPAPLLRDFLHNHLAAHDGAPWTIHGQHRFKVTDEFEGTRVASGGG